MLAPAAVRLLLAKEPQGGAAQRRIAGRYSGGAQGGDHVEDPIGEVDAPKPREAAVGPLRPPQQRHPIGERRADAVPQGGAEPLPVALFDRGQGAERRGSALQVGALGHAAAVHLGGIDRLQERRAAAALVGAKAAVGVAALQDEARRLLDLGQRCVVVGRNQRRLPVRGAAFQLQQGDHRLGRAVAHRPAVLPIGEAEAAEDRIAVLVLVVGQLGVLLQAPQVTVGTLQRRRHLGAALDRRRAGDQRLHDERRVPGVAARPAVADSLRLVLPLPRLQSAQAGREVGVVGAVRIQRQAV